MKVKRTLVKSNHIALLTASQRQKQLGVPDLRNVKARLSKKMEKHAALKPNSKIDRMDESVGMEQHRTAVDSSISFFKYVKTVVENCNVIMIVLDCRDPLATLPTQIETWVKSHSDRRLILVLNKIDLVPKDVVQAWIRYLSKQAPTIAFKASTQSQSNNLQRIDSSFEKTNLSQSGSVGAQELVQLLKNYSRSLNIKTSITVGVIGYPNVGKSSIINSLKRTRACKVASVAGSTRINQIISLDKNIKLMDCPGVVFNNEESGLDSVEKAQQRGKIRKGGVYDIEEAALLVLNDASTGKIIYYQHPPIIATEKQFVSELKPELKLE